MIKQFLLTPGPTPIPDEVRTAMAESSVHHRTPQFSKIFTEVQEGLKAVFGTRSDVLILAASGTGAMEAAVTNLFSPGEKVLVVNGGKFGERWLWICKSFGLHAIEIKVEWGKAANTKVIKKHLQDHPDIQGVLVQASETSTTSLHPVREIAEITRTGPLLIVDGITAVGVLPLSLDELGIDVLITGSQKALMIPPGLAFISLSERAWARTKTAKLPRFYYDLRLERKSQAKGTTAFTPAISLIFGLRAALQKIQEEGLDRVYARHERLARATRAAATALGLGLLAPENPSPAVTGIFVPDKIDADQLLDYLRDHMGIIFAEGQDQLRGKIIRIAHVGYMGAFDVLVAVSALEMALRKFGFPVKFGQGVSAAQEILMEALD
ncbi:MAG: pyridoxal-phosphate-dependent aminotransferase family protein [Candidatus Binatia bacterium]